MVKAVVVGGSIGGLSVALALLKAGVEVTVFEKSSSVAAAGAGLGLDSAARAVLESFGLAEQFKRAMLPLNKEVNRFISAERQPILIARDDELNSNSTHWVEIHTMLRNALPDELVKLGHRVISVTPTSDMVEVQVEYGGSQGKQSIKQTADVVIAADGSMSDTRRKFLPEESRRYSGYCAWRGVMQEGEEPEVAALVREAYPDMGSCLFFDVTQQSGHAVLYELPGKRLNWLWYVNQPEPELRGTSVTVKAEPSEIEQMQQKAREVFPPALAALMKATASPFINAIFDREPLEQWVWGRIALMGEAAHPTTPHGLRSTNMAIADAGALGKAFEKHGDDIPSVLQEYQEQRLQVTSREVLFSRWLGQVKQGITNPSLQWKDLPEDFKQSLLQRSVKDFDSRRTM